MYNHRKMVWLVYCLIFVYLRIAIHPISCGENLENSSDEDSSSLSAEDSNILCPSKTLSDLVNILPLGNRGERCCSDPNDNKNGMCFSNKKNSGWEQIAQLPYCPDQIKPEFMIFTPDQPVGKRYDNNRTQQIDFFDLNRSVNALHSLNVNRQFFVIIHGFNTKSWDRNWIFDMKNALLDLDHNVMVVKWTGGSNVQNYVQAAANIRSVGLSVVHVINRIILTGKAKLALLTLIGFSLGAQMSGFVGSQIKDIPRIIGLDPAGPLFTCASAVSRLDSTDAHFVQVWHTNGDSVANAALGTFQPLGHVDFYINGGRQQPGCHSLKKSLLTKVQHFDVPSMVNVSCSHGKAPLIFINLLRQQADKKHKCKFVAFPCSGYRDWYYGRCFNCSRSSEGCLAPGLDLFNNPSVKRPGSRQFFSTLSSDANSFEFCGWQYLVTIVSPDGAKGRIELIFLNNGKGSDISKFQRSASTLKPNVPRSTVVAIPWTEFQQIQLMYTRFSATFRKSGPTSFTITNLTAADMAGKKHTFYGPPVTIEHGKSLIIDVK